MQNEDFQEPLGPLTMDEHGCLNLRSSPMNGQVVTQSVCPGTLPMYARTELMF